MKTFAINEKRSASAGRKASLHVHHPMRPAQLAQQAEIRRILHSTGAQARLTISQPNDKYEQEADRVADQVMRMPDPKLQRQPENEEEEEMLQAKPLADQISPLIQRQAEPEEEEEELIQPGHDQEPEELTPLLESVPTRDAGELGGEEEELIQPKSDTGAARQVTSGIARDIQSINGTGQPLPTSERAFFEPRFGGDFSQVRVHNDNRAGLISRSINARAFTLGRDVVFGAGQYSPGTPVGRKLLAHELTHVVQQRQGGASSRPLRSTGSFEHSGYLAAPSLLSGSDPKRVFRYPGGLKKLTIRGGNRTRLIRMPTIRKVTFTYSKLVHGGKFSKRYRSPAGWKRHISSDVLDVRATITPTRNSLTVKLKTLARTPGILPFLVKLEKSTFTHTLKFRCVKTKTGVKPLLSSALVKRGKGNATTKEIIFGVNTNGSLLQAWVSFSVATRGRSIVDSIGIGPISLGLAKNPNASAKSSTTSWAWDCKKMKYTMTFKLP